jgi:probable rRNA maturation factor
MTVLITNDFGLDGGDAAKVAAAAEQLLVFASKEPYEISILLTGDGAIQEINSTWRQKDKATNVLSFPMDDDPDSVHPMLGDIIISIDTARREAADKKLDIATYLQRLLVHGFVHLLGYDHEESDAAYDKMLAQEHIFLQKLNKENNNG